MGYNSLFSLINSLERQNELIRISEEVNSDLEMAAIHRKVNEVGGPAILFENIKDCSFKAISNIFGTYERTRFIFRDSIDVLQSVLKLKNNPLELFKQPFTKMVSNSMHLINALPKVSGNQTILDNTTTIDHLPLIRSWPKDGGAFITLPIVYSEDIESPGVKKSNLGMYRIQLNGNEYQLNKEIGVHYQIHRGIGVHQAKANERGVPLKVSIFIGGPPAHTIGAVMPLPEGLSETMFVGLLANRRFRYFYHDGFAISADADFVITGTIDPYENKPEGPFGDHLGYYSLTHDFPVMKVHQVYHKNNAIWPFTVVGRPPQEDSNFGKLIHELVGDLLPEEIPGLKQINAVDAAGVHPLLLAVGSERYTPYSKNNKPAEILTIANRILGTGQLSLAKYLFIGSVNDNSSLNAEKISAFFHHILLRVDLTRDLHFYTQTTMDTLDYSGNDLNSGSKLVIAAAGKPIRKLIAELPSDLYLPNIFTNPKLVLPGVLVVFAPEYVSIAKTTEEVKVLEKAVNERWSMSEGLPLIILCDDSLFVAKHIHNFLWVTFTRSNPATDIFGVNSFVKNKHWGCNGPLIIDARIKSHHAPLLEEDPEILKKVNELGAKGKSLYGVI